MAIKKAMQKILLVDDDEVHLAVARSMLEEKYQILTAKSGKEALGFFFKGEYPNLVLLDVFMPNMDGWETYKRIKALSFLKDIPIAFFTSSTEITEKDRAIEIGAADFITKPFEKKDLFKRVKTMLKKHEKIEKLTP